MEFKPNHYYRMRNGEQAQYIGKMDYNVDKPHIFVHSGDTYPETYSDNGAYFSGTETQYDIIEEWS